MLPLCRRVALPPSAICLACLGQVQRGDGVLAHGFLILLVQFGILVLDDLAHANLRQFLGHQFLVEQPALDRRLVLHEGGDDLVQVLAANALGFRALGLGQSLDLDLELPGLLVEADVALVRIIAAFAIVEARRRSAARILRLELEARRKHLLHEQGWRRSL